ncbi:MAG: ribokinase, partial [Acidobacteriota bacterium]
DKAMGLIKDSSYVLLQYEIPKETIYYIIEKCHERGVKVMFNMAPAGEFDSRHIAMVDTLVVNEVEAALLSKTSLESFDEVHDAALIIQSMGPKNVIIALLGDF